MATDPSSRQRYGRTSRVEQDPAPGPWPQTTPVFEVSPPDGQNYRDYTDDDGSQADESDFERPGGDGPDGTPPVISIGTVTVLGDVSPTVGDTRTYTATSSGNAMDVVFTFSAPGETFTGGEVTWANDGATTVTCTATSATAGDSGASGTLAVTVGVPATGIGNVTVTGDGGNTRRAGEAQSFTAAADGNATDITWSWTATNDGVITGTGATVTVIWPGTNATRAGSAQGVTATATSPLSDPTTATGNTTIDIIPAENAVADVQSLIDSTAFNAAREQNLTVQAADFVNQFVQQSAAGQAAAEAAVPGFAGAVLEGGFDVIGPGGQALAIPAGGVAYVNSTQDGGAWANILAAAGVADAIQAFAGSNGEGCALSWFLIINQDQLDANTNEDYGETIRHELLHGLGIGQFWDGAVAGAPALTADIALAGATYTNTLAAFNAATAATAIDIPLEAATGPGDAGLAVGDHWELDNRTVNGVLCPGVLNDIMLGRAADGLVLTQLSISNMVDMGYEEIVAGTVEGPLATTFALPPAGRGVAKSYQWTCVHRDGGINIVT